MTFQQWYDELKEQFMALFNITNLSRFYTDDIRLLFDTKETPENAARLLIWDD